MNTQEKSLSRGLKRDHTQSFEASSLCNESSAFPRSVIPQAESLCPRCQSIDLDEVFRRKVEADLGSFIIDLQSTVQELESSDCELCQLFASVSPLDHEKYGYPQMLKCHLRAFSAGRAFSRLKPDEMLQVRDSTLLAVLRTPIKHAKHWSNCEYLWVRDSLKETGYLGLVSQGSKVQPAEFGARLLHNSGFDIQYAKYCITYCRKYHGPDCSSTNPNSVNFFRVIDCNARTIITAPPNCQYTALSYVWGAAPTKAPTDHTNNFIVSLTRYNIPKVIQDSIDVTVALNLQYLWVDRYCINQFDEQDKDDQIHKMDLVYSNAQVTIIAAAGEDSNYGLAGVNGIPRKLQPTLNVKGRIITSTLPHPSYLLKDSKWATRGWTYQEGLLSRCRLIFTSHQFIYKCNNMHCEETVLKPLDAMHYLEKSRFKESIPSGAFGREPLGRDQYRFMHYVQEFCRREVSLAEDILNAMQAVFSAYEKSKQPVYQFMGVQILFPHDAYSNFYLEAVSGEAFLFGLTWYHPKPGKRRPHFPSWS
jgi:hypothetical protein